MVPKNSTKQSRCMILSVFQAKIYPFIPNFGPLKADGHGDFSILEFWCRLFKGNLSDTGEKNKTVIVD